jgi:hypothetical protein
LTLAQALALRLYGLAARVLRGLGWVWLWWLGRKAPAFRERLGRAAWRAWIAA